MQDHMIPDITERQYPVDPVEEFAMKLERDEEAYIEELREGIVDAVQVLTEKIADLDHDYPSQETNDARLLVKAVIDTLEEV